MDANLQLGYFICLLNKNKEISLSAHGQYLSKFENIVNNLKEQGHIVDIEEGQSINIKNSKGIDVQIAHIKKGLTSSEIISICTDSIIKDPTNKKPIMEIIEKIKNGNRFD